VSSSSRTVGSSPNTSSPTAARAIASRMASVGLVTVSLRKSTTASAFWFNLHTISDDEYYRPAAEKVVLLQLSPDAPGIGRADDDTGPERIVDDADRLHDEGQPVRIHVVHRQAPVAHGFLRIVHVPDQPAPDDHAGVGFDARVDDVAVLVDDAR